MKKLIYKSKFNGDMDSLPHDEHMPGAVKFKEFEDTRTLGIFANALAFGIMVICFILFFLRSGGVREGLSNFSFIGCILSVVIIFPHEFLHAICFKETVYLYTNYRQGMVFVIGTETMSKARYVFLSLLPNIVFGFIPFAAFLIDPDLNILGTMGAATIGMGAGDYYNVFNALTQMPKGARTYLHKFNSYWYMPEDMEQKGGIKDADQKCGN